MAIAVVLFAAAFSKTSPPREDESIGESDASWRAESKPAEDIILGTLHIQLEKTTLLDVQDAVEVGSIRQQGDAAEHVLWLCYTVRAQGHPARVWIESSGEMGGSDHVVTQIAARSISNTQAPSECPTLPPRFEPVTLGHGLWLGVSEATVRKTFPVGLMGHGHHLFIGFRGTLAGDCEGGYDLLNSLTFGLQSGRVDTIDADQVTSC